MKNKIDTYVGFAIRKNSVVFGVDNIAVYKKKMYCILHTEDISENSLSRLQAVAERRGCPLRVIPSLDTLENKNCKALAICDKSLSDAVLNNL